jgi:hypothetical protein
MLGGKRVKVTAFDLFLDPDVDDIGRLKNRHLSSSLDGLIEKWLPAFTDAFRAAGPEL